jgi:anti-sigma B factor antagonist
MRELATIEIEEGDVVTARIEGEMDISNAARISERILGAVSNQSRGLVVDLRKTAYLDSSGIQLIFEMAEKLKRRQQRLHLLVAEGSFIAEVLQTVAAEEVAPMHTDPEEAVRAVGMDEL